MSDYRIILIEDEEDIADLIKLQAEMSGYKIHWEADGLKGFMAVEKEKPDLVILDIMLPGLNGLDVCRKMKAHPDLKHTPIIFLSAKGEEIDQVVGLELGADDYITKPFSPKVLLSKVKAVLRRKEEPEVKVKVLKFGSYFMDLDSYSFKKNDKPIALTLSEFSILRRLATNKGKVLTRNQLLDELQGEETFVVDRNIDVHIASLRKKLGPNFEWIETVRGLGYRFLDE